LKDDGVDLDDRTAIYAVEVPTRSLVYMRITGEKQEMYDQQGVA
jgi:hypothetical protein